MNFERTQFSPSNLLNHNVGREVSAGIHISKKDYQMIFMPSELGELFYSIMAFMIYRSNENMY